MNQMMVRSSYGLKSYRCWVIWAVYIIHVKSSYRHFDWSLLAVLRGSPEKTVVKLTLSGLVCIIFYILLIRYEIMSLALWAMYDRLSSEFIMGAHISLIYKDGILIVLSVIFMDDASFSFLYVHPPSFDIMDASFDLIIWSSFQA